MDKYTIDLDQLLDDFEYSELTDQHSASRERLPSQERQLSRKHSKDLTTKHSINNVFHSLNEYLSTSIAKSNKVVLEEGNSSNVSNDNNLINNKENIHLEENNVLNKLPDPKLESNDINENIRIYNINSDVKNESVSQLNYKNEKTENILDIRDTLDSSIPDTYPETVLANSGGNDAIFCAQESKDNLNTDFPEIIKNDHVNDTIQDEIKEEVNTDITVETIITSDNANVIEKDNTNSEENSIIDSDKGVIENNKPNGQTEEYLSLIDNMEHESTEEDNSMESKFVEMLVDGEKIVENKEVKLEETVLQEDKTKELAENKVDNSSLNNLIIVSDEDTKALTVNEENIKANDLLDVERSESPKMVGFTNEIEVDDSELAKMLDDLEEDEELGNMMHPIAETKGRCDSLHELKTFEEENEDCENINNLNEEIERTKNYTVDNSQYYEAGIKTPRQETNMVKENYEHKTKLDNTEISVVPHEVLKTKAGDVLEDSDAGSHVKVPETESSVAEPERESVNDNHEEPKTEQTLAENLEVPLEANTSSLESSQNSDSSTKGNKPQRPHDLPLNNLKTQEEKARKINLIGSPGSTPYNNIYLNKTGSKRHKNEESEGEYSTSPSPTFSDVSTDSTSTASTVSIEDIERTKNNLAKNVNAEKENNLEKEARSLQESRLQGTGDGQQEDNADRRAPESIQNLENELGQNRNLEQGENVQQHQWTGPYSDKSWLGKEAPLWIPDADASACLHCDMKFTMIKRRHHCRACGLVLCAKCCNLKFKLEYLDAEARVCQKCFNILSTNQQEESAQPNQSSEASGSPSFRPNPNNPSEYCSTVSPLQQVEQTGVAGGSNPPSVMVPVGVLKRKGSNKSKHNKSVMFCDGIAPGSDLTNLDKDFNYQDSRSLENANLTVPKQEETTTESGTKEKRVSPARVINSYPKVDEVTNCLIPSAEDGLPPIVDVDKFFMSNIKAESIYSECTNCPSLVERLKNETLCFAITTQLFVNVKIINMDCCINKTAWCFSTEGLINVGNDEIVYLLECLEDENSVPKEIFSHVHSVYLDAMQGNSIKELGLSLHNTSNFLDSKNHAGFVYIKPTFQCLENVIKPKEPSFLLGILIHRWETPWAKLFPLRLILRLGAEYRYYPSPIISTRHRDSVFVEIGHTIINLLADFRNYSYTLPQIRGLIIHMEDKTTTITIPRNRYDQVTKAITSAPEHILAFSGNFSPEADSHLVCIQDTQGNENNYTTHAINIHNKPRKITGASFIIFNGSLKPNAGFTAKSNIIEDGLMIQILPEDMVQIRDNLRSMKDHTITCCTVGSDSAEETVKILWGENDINFNVGVSSPVDHLDMKGVPSIRVHNGKDFISNTGTRVIRWTEVFLIQNSDDDSKNQDPVDISKVSESIARASCNALANYLELLLSNSCSKIGIRATLDADNVSYLAGSNGKTLPPIYMKSLDDELIPILHKLTSNTLGDHVIVLELIFRILAA